MPLCVKCQFLLTGLCAIQRTSEIRENVRRCFTNPASDMSADHIVELQILKAYLQKDCVQDEIKEIFNGCENVELIPKNENLDKARVVTNRINGNKNNPEEWKPIRLKMIGVMKNLKKKYKDSEEIMKDLEGIKTFITNL